jgi:triphosphoribosyl-dephospho-CoA synthase
LTDALIHTHIQLIATHGDSLIARKCGPEESRRATLLAGQVLAAGGPGHDEYSEALSDFDFWLRSDGHRRNPGTTADLIAAALFAGLRDGRLNPPYR